MTAMFRVRKAGIAGTSVALCCLSLIFVVEAKNGVAGKTEEWHEREFRLGLTGADYVVFALDGTGPLFVGTFVTKSEADAGRTVVYMFDQKGRPFRRVPFPEGYFAAAICPDRDKSLYGLCRDKEGDWRLVKLSLSGRVIWNNSVSQLDGKKALLVVSRDDWGKVCIAPSAKKGEFVVLWHSDGSRPEVGSLTFRGDTGKVGKALEGIMDAQGHRYLVEGNEVTVAKEGVRSQQILSVDNKNWGLAHWKGTVFLHVYEDGKTGAIHKLLGHTSRVVRLEAPSPVRANDAAFYSLDKGKEEILISNIESDAHTVAESSQ